MTYMVATHYKLRILSDKYPKDEGRFLTVMDKMYNVQQLEERFGQQTKFPVLVSMNLSLLNKFKQTLDDTMIWKLQEVYIPS